MKYIKDIDFVIVLSLSLISLSVFGNDEVIEIRPGDFKAVYLIRDSSIDLIQIHLIVQSGEAENPFEEGMAHYVEHIAWLNVLEAGRGFQHHNSNAWTTHLSTGYWVSGPKTTFPGSANRTPTNISRNWGFWLHISYN